MKPNNIYMTNEDLQSLCPGKILLQQQDSQSLKHPTMKTKRLAAFLECY